MSKQDVDKIYVRDVINEILFPTSDYRSVKKKEERSKEEDNSKNVDSSICAKCGGKCCKICGCHFSPDDFKDISFEGLKKEIEKGYISIDYVDPEICYSDYGIYILIVRNQGAPIVDTGVRRTPCSLLTSNGCKLSYEDRPTGGKMLIPSNIMKCESKYSIYDCCYDWKTYQNVLYQLVQYFRNRNFPCSL